MADVDAAVDAAIPIDAPEIDAPGTATLTIALAGTSTGTVTSNPAGIDCGTTCSLSAAIGTMVTLTAAPDAGAAFAGFSGGGCTGTATTCVVTLAAATTVTATFNTARYTVTVNLMGNGTGSVSSTPAGISCPGTCTMTVDHGTSLSLTATAAGGSTFVGWAGSCVGTGACAVTVTADTTLTASFALNSSLVVTKAGNGSGTVTSAPAGINCGVDCSEAYTPGTIVTLTATPAVGSTFTGWSGAGCTGTGVCTITLNAAQMVTATFTLNQYTLTVTKNGTATGTVTGTGINCGADCTEQMNHGSSVTLTATAGANATFAGWTGGGCTGTGTCTVTVTAATTVTATFNLVQRTLTVAKAGTGTGTVTSSPAGISCGADCTEPYNHGTSVTLTATAAAGSTFAGWSGGGCSGTGTCVVTMTAATAVTATFTLTAVVVTASWNCAGGVSCTDLYDITFSADSNVTFAVTAVTGASVLRLGAFNPGVPYTGANLLTGIASDRKCVAQNTSDTVVFKAVSAGTYRLAVGRDWGSSAGASGTYTLTVSSTGTMTYVGASGNDVVEGTTASRCGYIATFSSSWTCASGVSCQDTYSFDSLASTTATVAATAITGNSVVRQAVFNGTTVTTTNQLNGMLTDRKCAAQNANDTATSAALPAGGHLFAIGRDWGSSAGASGTYTYTITTPNVPLVPRGQVTNDTGSAFATTTCP
ncbi:MAG: hypothetical protein IPL61_37830 [Myxococcales bacterium]|nr:hypothetical protein [Myxococcales bacterium]